MGTTPETAEAKLAYVRMPDGTLYRIGGGGGGGGAQEIYGQDDMPEIAADILWVDTDSTVTDPGAAGTLILEGTAVPTGATGAEGNYYLDTDHHILYGPKAADTSWPVAVAAPLILGPADPLPAGTPSGILVIRTEA